MGWTFRPTPDAAYETRRRLRTLLAWWGVSTDDVDVVLLVANELVANAVDHAGSSFTVNVGRDRGMITIGVADASDAVPILRPHDPSAVRGRGLQMVHALAAHWSSVPTRGGGKTVWAVVDVGARVR